MPNRSPLKIAFVADTIHTDKAGGGVVAARQVIAKLRQRHQVWEIGADADGPGVVPGLALPFRSYRESQFVIARPDEKVLSRIIEAVDVVHLQFPFRLSRAALKIARRLNKPVVAAFHVQPENVLRNLHIRADWVSAAIYRSWIDAIYSRVDAVICPTPFAQAKLRARGLTVPTVVISNGVSPDVQPEEAVRDAAYDNKFLIVMAGRLAPEKRHDVVLNALRQSKHASRISLVIAGAGRGEEHVRSLASGLSSVAVAGFLTRAQLVHLYNTADLLVHSSEVELEGMAVLEAMSVGLPALVAQAPQSAASAFAIDDDFRFPAGDSVALAAQLDRLIEQPELIAAARIRARAFAKQFDFAASVEALEQLYWSVTGPAERDTAAPGALAA